MKRIHGITMDKQTYTSLHILLHPSLKKWVEYKFKKQPDVWNAQQHGKCIFLSSHYISYIIK